MGCRVAKGAQAVDVSGNWRITFSVNADGEFEGLDYEDYHWEISAMETMHDPAHPGEILREELATRGTTITAAARALGVTRKALSDVVNLKAGVSPVMARRLEAALGTPARLWIDLQATYDLSQANAADLGDVRPIRASAG